MRVAKAIEREIETHRRLIGRLKREIFGIDKTHRSRYIREFNAEFRSFRRPTTAERVIDHAARCDVVYFGDYHPLDSSQEWAARLMRGLLERGRPVVLALEMLYVHQQEHLDRWMKGRMSEKEFLDAIDYRSEWGFSWPSFRRLFDLAKDPFVPIFGIDSEPRDNLRFIRRRDRLAARRIATIRRFFPGHAILVVVGESHVASRHLPAEVRRAVGTPFRETIIVQNMDDIYWRLLRRGRENVEAVIVDDDRFCVLTTSPLLKYQAYRDIIETWSADGEIDRHASFLHDTIESLVAFLGARDRSVTVTVRGGWREPLAAMLPEVRCRATYDSFGAWLRSRRASPREIEETRERLRADGMTYIPRFNTFLVVSFERSRAVREAARFVLHALRDDVGRPRQPAQPSVDEFHRAVLEEALVCFAAEIVDPSRSCPVSGAPGDPLGGYRRVLGLRFRKRYPVIAAQGALLAEVLHRAYHAGRLSSRQIAALFRNPLAQPGEAVRLHRKLLDLMRAGGAGRSRKRGRPVDRRR